jgi:hypothetical protein
MKREVEGYESYLTQYKHCQPLSVQVLDRAERLQNTPEFSSYLKLRELVCAPPGLARVHMDMGRRKDHACPMCLCACAIINECHVALSSFADKAERLRHIAFAPRLAAFQDRPPAPAPHAGVPAIHRQYVRHTPFLASNSFQPPHGI